MLFAAIVEQVINPEADPNRSPGNARAADSARAVGDLQPRQLVELAAASVERVLPQLPEAGHDEMLRLLETWHDWSDGRAGDPELGASADAVRDSTSGPASTSAIDPTTVARVCVRMAADTARAAAQMETADTPTLRDRLLWKARMAAERARMVAELLMRRPISARHLA